MTTKLCECGGSGTFRYVERGAEQSFGPNMIGQNTTHGTSLCDCRTKLELRDGRAEWWDLVTLSDVTITIPIGMGSVRVRVQTERPISRENYLVVRRGNRCYPTLVDIDVDSALSLLSADALALGLALTAAAQLAEDTDAPDLDVCGHWWPCDCAEKTA